MNKTSFGFFASLFGGLVLVCLVFFGGVVCWVFPSFFICLYVLMYFSFPAISELNYIGFASETMTSGIACGLKIHSYTCS